MHPELQHLDQQYRQIVAALQSGHLSEQDALGVLAGMSAVDGEGAVWTIDPYSGDFVRSYPGQAPVPANPAMFVPAQLPTPPMPGFGEGYGTAGLSPHIPPSLHPPAPVSGFQRAGHGVGSSAAKLSQLPASFIGSLRRLVGGRGRTAILVAVAVLAVLVMFANRPGSAPADDVTFGATPSSTVAPKSSSTVPTGDSSTEDVQDPLLLSPEQVQAVLVVLSVGASDQITALFQFDGFPELRPEAMALLGAARAGLALETPDPASSVDGMAILVVAARYADGAVAATWVVTLAPTPEGWRIIRVAAR